MSPVDAETYGIEFVGWPHEEATRRGLARAGIPRLLLVAPGFEPPEVSGADEDWIRLPASDADIKARARQLARAVAHLHAERPWIDDHRVLHRGREAVSLSASEAAVADVLLDHPGAVIQRHELSRRLWPDGEAPSERAVDAVVYRLRRRISGLGLTIRSARSEGFTVDVD